MPSPKNKPKSGAGKGKAAKPKGRTWSHELDVVGLKFRTKASARRAIADSIAKRGSITGMRLEREPENPADMNAIKVLMPERAYHGLHIGYLRAPSAELLAPRIDRGTLEVTSAKLESLDAADDYNSGALVVRFRDIS